MYFYHVATAENGVFSFPNMSLDTSYEIVWPFLRKKEYWGELQSSAL